MCRGAGGASGRQRRALECHAQRSRRRCGHSQVLQAKFACGALRAGQPPRRPSCAAQMCFGFSHPATTVVELIKSCWCSDPSQRPTAEEVVQRLPAVAAEEANEQEPSTGSGSSGPAAEMTSLHPQQASPRSVLRIANPFGGAASNFVPIAPRPCRPALVPQARQVAPGVAACIACDIFTVVVSPSSSCILSTYFFQMRPLCGCGPKPPPAPAHSPASR